MKLPRLAAVLLRRCAPPARVEDVLGDLEEVHGARVRRHGERTARLLTTLEAMEIAGASLLLRIRDPRHAPVSWIDLKLGLRMLAKYPGLTMIGGLAMAFGIFAGAVGFEFYSQVLHPELPFDEGDRVVDISMIDDRTQEGHRPHAYDFDMWRTRLSSIEDLGAARFLTPNLGTGEGFGEPVRAAAMTASAFRMARVAPLMGRTLGTGDASPAAPDVAVIGHEVWQNRLGADPDVIGRTVFIGDVPHTVVGVMPPGFGFPRSEQLWLPLRFDRAALAPLEGPWLMVFGRLAPGRRIEEARTELDGLIARAGLDRPDVYEHLHARVLPYAESFSGIENLADPDRIAAYSVNLVAWLFLVLVCGNVALLMFARAAAREGEIVVRTALGASRRRIVAQLFSEALVLGAVAGLVGVGAAAYALHRYAAQASGAAFWFRGTLSPETLVYAGALVVFTAVMTGALPGLRITSQKVDARLRSASAGGGGLRLGGVWTAIIVVQVAATVTFPAIGWFVGAEAANIRAYEPDFPTEEFVATGLRLDAAIDATSTPSDSTGRGAYAGRLARIARALTERLEAEPWVKGVTRTAHLPGTSHGWRRIEMDEGGEEPRTELDRKGPGRWVYGGKVAPDFFEVLGAEATQGRTFHEDDAHPEARTVVVNEAFVDQVLGGRNPLGRRLRYLGSPDEWDGVALGDDPGPWYRIVGVVPDLGMSNGARGDELPAGFYHAVTEESLLAPTLLVRLASGVGSPGGRLREIAAEVEPDLALVRLRMLDEVKEEELRTYIWAILLLLLVSGVGVLLSLAGIYAAMSFAVARRTREIGVRVALGAGPGRVLWAIFRRPLTQTAAGLLLGLLISGALSGTMDSAGFWGKPLLVLLAYAAFVTSVCLLACIVPVRRALGVEPSEALGAEG